MRPGYHIGKEERGQLSGIYRSPFGLRKKRSGTGAGYRDPGWSRQASEPTPEALIDKQGRLHRYADHNLRVPHDCELTGKSVGGVRRYLGLEIRRRPYP